MRFKLLRLSPHFWFRTQEDSHPAHSPPDPSRRPSFILRRSTSLKLVKSSSPAAPPDHNRPHLPPPAAPRPANVRRVCTVVDAGCACRATVTSSTRRQEPQEIKRERSPTAAPTSTARPMSTAKSPLDVGGGERPKPTTAASKEAALLEWKLPRDMNAAEFLAMSEDKNSYRRNGRKKAGSPPLAGGGGGGSNILNLDAKGATQDRDFVVLETDARGTDSGWPPRISSSSSSGGGEATNHHHNNNNNNNRALIMMAEDAGVGRSSRPGREEEIENDEGRIRSRRCRQLWRPWPAGAGNRACSVDADEAWPRVTEAGEMAAAERRRSMSYAEGGRRKMGEEEEEEEWKEMGGGQIQVMLGRRRRRRKAAAEAVAMAKRSVDPKGDFKKSMEEMVEAKGLGGHGQLQELLQCYLCLNPRRYHAAIVSAFHDLLASHPPPPPPYGAAASSLSLVKE